MIRIFQSSWFVTLAGCLLYLGTSVAVLSPSKFSGARTVREPGMSAEDDPSWKFRNPEFNQWVAQIKDEKEALALREQQLNEWQTRLDAERQEVSSVTQTVAQLQANFDNNVVRFKAQETDNVKHQAKLLAAMSPDGAVTMINGMPDDDVVRILFTMKVDEASVILETMGKADKDEARRAALLTARLHQILPETTTATASSP